MWLLLNRSQLRAHLCNLHVQACDLVLVLSLLNRRFRLRDTLDRADIALQILCPKPQFFGVLGEGLSENITIQGGSASGTRSALITAKTSSALFFH